MKYKYVWWPPAFVGLVMMLTWLAVQIDGAGWMFLFIVIMFVLLAYWLHWKLHDTYVEGIDAGEEGMRGK